MKLFQLLRQRGIIILLYKLRSRIYNTDPSVQPLCDRIGTYNYLLKRYKSVITENVDADTNIIEKLPNPYPNKIWTIWFQGYENAPLIVKRCIRSIRENAGDRELIILDNTNISKYVSIPSYILEKKNKGIIPLTHFSDYIRLQLLNNYGGTWLDATILLTEPLPAFITNKPLFLYKSLPSGKVICSNNFIHSNMPHNHIIMQLQRCLDAYWKKENNLVAYGIFHIFCCMIVENDTRAAEMYNCIPYFDNINREILSMEIFNPYSKERFEQIKRISPIHKLSYKYDLSHNTPNSFYNHLLKE